MNNDAIVEVLLRELFDNFVSCGPGNAQRAYHPRMSEVESINKELYHIIPDYMYHPEVYIAIDFTHQFVVASDNEDIQGERPLSATLLKNAAKRLLSYVSYYFEYVLSYGKGSSDHAGSKAYTMSWLVETVNEVDIENESDVLWFINTLLQFFLTDVAVDRARTSIGTATITLRDNPNIHHGQKINIFLNKSLDILNQLFVPMLPVMVWAKGRLYKDWYFPIFDGYIMMANTANAQGYTNLTITCKDVLELARTSQEMVNPAVIKLKEFRQQSTINIFQKPFYGQDHMKLFTTMFHGGKLLYPPDGPHFMDAPLVVDKFTNPTGRSDKEETDGLVFSALGKFGIADETSQVTTPSVLQDDKAIHKDQFGISKIVTKVQHKERPRYTSSWGHSITPYKVFMLQSPNTFTSEFSSRLDILQGIAGMVYYELYVDGYGNIQYHPMRLVNDYLQYDIIKYKGKEKRHLYNFPGVQVVGQEEIINVNSALNIEELCTFMRLYGVPPTIGEQIPGDVIDMLGSAIDKLYMQKYGYRRREVKNNLFNYNPEFKTSDGKKVKFLDLAAEELLKYMNAELYSRTATLVFRPELELALPVFFPDDNSVFYVQSISHSITVGGDATTTINSNFGRKDKITPPKLAEFILKNELLHKLNANYNENIYQAILEAPDGVALDAFYEQEQSRYVIPYNAYTKHIEEQDANRVPFDEQVGDFWKNVEKDKRDEEAQASKAETKPSRDAAQKVKQEEEILLEDAYGASLED